MSKIDFGWSILGTNDPNPNRSSSIFRIWIRDPKSIFRMSKIADEKLWSVSFHNHLVARYHIYNPWRNSSSSASSAHLGKMGKFLICLRTPDLDPGHEPLYITPFMAPTAALRVMLTFGAWPRRSVPTPMAVRASLR